MAKVKDVVVTVPYKDASGEEKKRYIQIGAVFERDDGSQSIKLEIIPIGWNGWANFYAPREKQNGSSDKTPSARNAPPVSDSGQAPAEDQEDLPF